MCSCVLIKVFLVWVVWEGSKLSLSVTLPLCHLCDVMDFCVGGVGGVGGIQTLSLFVTLPLCYVSDMVDFCVYVCVDQGFLV